MQLETSEGMSAARTRYLVLALVLLLLVATVGYAFGMPIFGLSHEEVSEQKPVQVGEAHKPSPQLSAIWHRGADGYEKAKQERATLEVPLVVYFYTDWCGYCRALDRDILLSEEVRQFMETVAKVRINPEEGAAERELARSYGVTGYPSVFVIPANNNNPKRIYPFVQVDDRWMAMSPVQFVAACKAAGLSPR